MKKIYLSLLLLTVTLAWCASNKQAYQFLYIISILNPERFAGYGEMRYGSYV